MKSFESFEVLKHQDTELVISKLGVLKRILQARTETTEGHKHRDHNKK